MALSSTFFPACAAPESPSATADGSPVSVYFGTYTSAKSKGIYRSTLDLRSGALTAPTLVAETPSPSFLALHQNGRFLYAVNEVGQFEGRRTGAVSAFAIDRDGALRLLNQASSLADGPCHLVVDPTGRNVLVANYGGGSTTVIPLGTDGSLGAPGSSIQHRGSSVNPQRQKEPHAHGVYLDPANRFAYVPDLGIDRVMIYRFDPRAHSLTPSGTPPYASLKPGAGPRHMAFHPNGRFAYVINELDSTITAFGYDAKSGRLAETQTVPTLPADFKGESTTAEIAVHPSGKFLYGSNRGHDSIAVFAVDPATGQLTFVQHEPTQGKTPRNFALDPTGAFLLAANQNSDNVVVFRVDAQTGKLTPTAQRIEVGAPVCVTFQVR